MGAQGLLIQPFGDVALAFGLDWYVLLGGHAHRQARRLARRHGATHVVLSGDLMLTVGLARMRRSRRPYSAAALAAAHFSAGTVALLLPVGESAWWLLGVHEGSVIARSDRLHTRREDALQALARLRQAYPALSLVPEGGHAGLLAQLAAQAVAQARLAPVPLWGRARFPYVAGAGLAVLLAMPVLPGWLAARSATPQAAPPALSARQAWQQAVREAARRHWVHGSAGTRRIMAELHSLPIAAGGWKLEQAQCLAQHAQWLCSARFRRGPGPASNASLLAAARPGWQLAFTPLEQARVSWQSPAAGAHAGQAVLSATTQNERQLFSHLQALRPALGSVAIAPAQPLPVAVPLDGEGRPLPRPDGLAGYQQRRVSLRAPLRVLGALLPHCAGFGWQKVSLAVSGPGTPGLKESRFQIILEGSLYETQGVLPDAPQRS